MELAVLELAPGQPVVNTKMLTEVVGRLVDPSSTRLLVCYSGAESEWVRTEMPRLYNDLWDAALESGRVDLDCVVLATPLRAFLACNAVATVYNAGRAIDPDCFCLEAGLADSVVSLAESLQEEVDGVPYVLFDDASSELGRFAKVAVGGTFDHFHNGHKKLLSIAMSVCSEELTVGVTASSMLASKKLGNLIEDTEVRMQHVHDFFGLLAPEGLRSNVVVIEDVWGPTVVDAEIEAIVVSTETLKGARLINEERSKRGMRPLKVIAVARSSVYTLSSTFLRKLRSKT